MTEHQPRILIVDDEPDLIRPLSFLLRRDHFQVEEVHDGGSCLERMAREPLPDLVLLDLMLPDIPGTQVCVRLRSNPRTAGVPIVMLTARGEEVDRIVGFELGADDYVTKPYSAQELILRLRAVLRRTQPAQDPKVRLHLGPLEVDPEGVRAWVSGDELTLTPTEFRLLLTLVQRRGRAQSRAQLLEAVWQLGDDTTERAVDTHIKRLRQKLGPVSDRIQTVRGIGYRFTDDRIDAG